MAATSTIDRSIWRNRPDEKPVMYQSWQKLLFIHWRYPAEVIQSFLPPGLKVDTWQGDAWVGVVPFYMRNIRPVWFPAVPWISNFLELNLRTYVIDEAGKPGVWFISLSANRRIAVILAKTMFHLPYHWSHMLSSGTTDGWIDYRCRRFADREKRVCHFKYRGTGETYSAEEGTLEFFLVERYLLFSTGKRGELYSGQVHHAPYLVQAAEVEQVDDTLLAVDGLPVLNRQPDHVLYAPGVDVEVFGLKSC